MRILVENLPPATTDAELQELFGRFGTVRSATIVVNHATGASRGYGFIDMPAPAEARAAIEGLNATEFHGRSLGVAPAGPRLTNLGAGGLAGPR